MASTINFTCDKCGENFSIILGSLAFTEHTNEDDLQSVKKFEESLISHEMSKKCDGKVVFKGSGNID